MFVSLKCVVVCMQLLCMLSDKSRKASLSVETSLVNLIVGCTVLMCSKRAFNSSIGCCQMISMSSM